ncbi:hypothetical protein WPS_21320 [Vulcanimicrobium alpinum]|uniref:Uncharacterized protein n=1 Tax=Vulcanimicrobium alpinum TaxID=3016050 RepID=A0AAN1XWV3_UNVUL|nr:hypothetical protein WPS_21320 [Vulcanimicrobium alpinum]
MIVGDGNVDAVQAACFEAAKELVPRRKALRIADRKTKDFSVSVSTNAARDEQRFADDALVGAHLRKERVNDDEWVRCVEPAIQESRDRLVECLRKATYRRFRKRRPTQTFGYPRDLPRRDAVDDHLHQAHDEGLFAAAITLEDVG